MLFYLDAFKKIISLEQLYSLRIPTRLNELEVPLRGELDEEFVFCDIQLIGRGYKLIPKVMFLSSKIQYYIKKDREITGFS